MALLLIWLGLLSSVAQAQAPAWQSVVAASDLSGVTALATDPTGNVYLAGFFAGTVSLGSVLLTSAGGSDLFVAKWNPATGFVWAQRAGGTNEETVAALAVSGSSVYVAGTFSSNTFVIGSTTLTNAGSMPPPVTTDVFVAKLTDLGTTASFDWAERAGGPSFDMARALAVQGSEVYMAGEFSGPVATFGGSGLALTNAGTGYSTDGFVAKLTDAGPFGVFRWAEGLGGPGFDYANALVPTATGVYVAGTFSSTALVAGATTLANAGGDDAYVARLVDNGLAASFAWAQRLGGPGEERGSALAVSGPNVYLAGAFNGTSLQVGGVTMFNAGGGSTFDAYVAKLTDGVSAGTFGWAQRAGGAESDFATAVAVSGSSIYLAGNFQSPQANFCATQLVNVNPAPVQGSSYADVFVARLSNAGGSGSFAWARQAGGARSDRANAVVLAGTSVYVGGSVARPASFGSFAITGRASDFIGFLAALADPVGLATRTPSALSSVVLAPNPAHAAATVWVPPVPGVAVATLVLVDALGRTVRTLRRPLPAAGATAELPLAGLAPGLYHLMVRAGDQQTSRTLVVE